MIDIRWFLCIWVGLIDGYWCLYWSHFGYWTHQADRLSSPMFRSSLLGASRTMGKRMINSLGIWRNIMSFLDKLHGHIWKMICIYISYCMEDDVGNHGILKLWLVFWNPAPWIPWMVEPTKNHGANPQKKLCFKDFASIHLDIATESGGLEHVLFSISYMGCYPSHWLSYVSRWLKPPTRNVRTQRSRCSNSIWT